MLAQFAHAEPKSNRKVRYNRITTPPEVRYGWTMETNIKSLRTARGMTQQQVYEMAGISKSYYSELESGKRQLNERLMKALADVFQVEPYMLVINHQEQSDLKFVSDLAKLDPDQRQLVHELAASLAKASQRTP